MVARPSLKLRLVSSCGGADRIHRWGPTLSSCSAQQGLDGADGREIRRPPRALAIARLHHDTAVEFSLSGVWAFLGVLQYLARFGVHADFLRDATALDV